MRLPSYRAHTIMTCKDCLSRREFIARSTMAVAGAAAIASGCGDGQFGPSALDSTVKTVSIKLGDFTALQTVDALVHVVVPPDASRPFATLLIVKRTGPASFAAFSAVCTHQQCDTHVDGNSIVCPCHGTHYDSDGRVTQQPSGGGSATNLPTYPTSYNSATDRLTIG